MELVQKVGQVSTSCLMIGLAVAESGVGSTAGIFRDQAVKRLTQEVSMGSGFSRLSETCIGFAAVLSADDFFEGLEIRQTPRTREFSRNSAPVTDFSSRLNVTVLTWVLKCGADKGEDPQRARELLQKLRFTAAWKTGLRTRPVKALTMTLRQPSAQEWRARSDTRKLEELGYPTEDPAAAGVWFFELTIEAEHVPLTDSLVVTLSSVDGKMISRFAARL